MSRQILLSTAALALVLAAHPAGAQTSNTPAGTQKQQTQQAPAAQAPAATQQSQQQPSPSAQQNAQQPAPSAQQNTQQPAPSAQQNAQQPTTGAQQQTTQQPATGTQQNAQQPSGTQQQTTQQPATGTQQNAQQPTGTQQQTTQQPATGTQQPSGAQQQTTQQPATGTQQPTGPQQRTTQQPATGTQTNQQTTQGGAASPGASVSLNTEQRTQISQVIARTNVEPLRNVNFSVSVGTVIPNTVRLHPLPADIVAIVPQYRGYSYVLVQEEIVIVEPQTHRIVAVVPYSGTRQSASTTRSSRKLELTREDRERVRRHAIQSRKGETTGTTTRRSRSYEVGEEVPRSVTVERFTETYEVPTVRRHRYFTEGDDVILVDPEEDRVIEIIR